MKIPFANSTAALSIFGLGAWVAMGAPVSQERSGGSAVPCAVPLAWRIARIDEAFGLSGTEAGAVLRQAGGLWEEAADRPLFSNDPVDGFPIRFVYDERQARTQERVRRQAEIDEVGVRLGAWRTELSDQGERQARDQSRHEERQHDIGRRVSDHNTTIRRWNERGGAPEDVALELRAVGEALDTGLEELAARRRELERAQRSHENEAARLNREVEEHRRRAAALARAFPLTPVESGRYREAVRWEEERAVSVSREIRIYRFDGPDDLLLVVAHELGHALGLGHAAAAGAVMSAEHLEGASAGVTAVGRHDMELLQARCPSLVSGVE